MQQQFARAKNRSVFFPLVVSGSCSATPSSVFSDHEYSLMRANIRTRRSLKIYRVGEEEEEEERRNSRRERFGRCKRTIIFGVKYRAAIWSVASRSKTNNALGRLRPRVYRLVISSSRKIYYRVRSRQKELIRGQNVESRRTRCGRGQDIVT